LRRRLTVLVGALLTLVLLAAAAVVGVHWWRQEHRTELEQASSYAPGDAERLSWTDWAAVRDRVGVHLDGSSSAAALQAFLTKGYDKDLTSTSALVQSAPLLQTRFGFSPASVDWELFSQSTQGAVVIMRMPDSTDFDAIGDRLERAGFTRPKSEDGVWLGGEELLPEIGADLTPELQYVALDRQDHLVLTSDEAGYLDRTVQDLGDGELSQGMQDVIGGTGEALSASVYDGPYTCSALAMSHADSSDQAQAQELLTQAGKVNPVTGFAMSAQPDGDVRVVLGFEDGDQARTNADTRAALAAGPAPGQGGTFPDRFSVGSVTADGRLVTMDLRPRQGAYVLSDLSTGPVLFATC
jgi:hypothetical protein